MSVVAVSAAGQGGTSEPFQTRSIKSAGTIQGAEKKVRFHWWCRVGSSPSGCAHPVDGPRYRIEFAERSLGAGSRGDGSGPPAGRATWIGQVAPRPDAHAACAGPSE